MDKLNICLNYYGQPRDTEITKNTFNTFINTNNINYYIVYTTWKDEKIDEFQQLFPNSYINLVDKPDMQNYDNLINNYRLDNSSILNRKSLEHYIMGLYIRKMSYTSIIAFEEKNNINFDFIVSLRPDIYLDNHLCNFYDIIRTNLDNVVYVANNPTFAIYYNQPALPEGMFISNKINSKKILEQLDILDKCVVNNTNFFHPESSFYNAITFLQINIYNLNLSAFPQYPIPRWS